MMRYRNPELINTQGNVETDRRDRESGGYAVELTKSGEAAPCVHARLV